jgi:hypothetical protein
MHPLFLCPEAIVGFIILLVLGCLTKDCFMFKLHERKISATLLLFFQGLAQKTFTKIIDNYKLEALS